MSELAYSAPTIEWILRVVAALAKIEGRGSVVPSMSLGVRGQNAVSCAEVAIDLRLHRIVVAKPKRHQRLNFAKTR